MDWPSFWEGFRHVFSGQSADDAWCRLTHGGGRIKRDEQGRINWQCDKCGRWSRHPVPLEDEKGMVIADLRRAEAQQESRTDG